MKINEITEENSIIFVNNLLDYFNEIDNGFIRKIYKSGDIEAMRDNVGWYQHIDNQHIVNINIVNVMCAKIFVDKGIIDESTFYAFLALCTAHEYRHFLQGRCIYEKQEIEGFGQNDVFNSELMLYVRYFFDAYYLLNKSNIKYELDAEKFAVIQGTKFLKDNYKDINAEESMVNAVNFYATLQNRGFIAPTLPLGCESFDEIVSTLSERLKNNLRNPDLRQTLFVYNPKFYTTHEHFGLNAEDVLSNELINNYSLLRDGSKQDLLIVNRILALLDKPYESLEEFPYLKKRYLDKSL